MHKNGTILNRIQNNYGPFTTLTRSYNVKKRPRQIVVTLVLKHLDFTLPRHIWRLEFLNVSICKDNNYCVSISEQPLISTSKI